MRTTREANGDTWATATDDPMTAEDHLRAAHHHLDAVVQHGDAGYLDQTVPAMKALEELDRATMPR